MRWRLLSIALLVGLIPTVASATKNPEINRLSAGWEEVQAKCAAAHSPKAPQCVFRDRVAERLKALGRCLTKGDYGDAQPYWVSCALADANASTAAARSEADQAEKAAQALRAADPNQRLDEQTEYLTKDGGLMCDFPGHRSEAGQAVNDPKWLKDIGCVSTRPGLKVIRTDDRFPIPHGEWRLRVFKEGGYSATMYAYSCDLAFTNGQAVRVCY